MNLETCLNLRELNLSCNNISDINGLKTLSNLLRLDLSCNKITRLKERSFEGLSSLTFLSLEGNSVVDVDNINGLGPLAPTLRTLYLQGYGGELANPLCGHPTYFVAVMRVLPSLAQLDGESLELREAVGGDMGDVVPDEKYTRDLPVEDWFKGSTGLAGEDCLIMEQPDIKEAVDALHEVLHEAETELSRAKGAMKNANSDLAAINNL